MFKVYLSHLFYVFTLRSLKKQISEWENRQIEFSTDLHLIPLNQLLLFDFCYSDYYVVCQAKIKRKKKKTTALSHDVLHGRDDDAHNWDRISQAKYETQHNVPK